MTSIIDANTKLVEDTLERQDNTLLQCLDDIAANSKKLAKQLGLPVHSNTK